ncbi:MAG: tetratricopeptide repeat protein [Verrucomicrobiota bacterium]
MIHRLLPIFLVFLLAAILPFTAQAQSTQAVFNQGVALYKQQNYVEALAKFEAVLRANPGYVYARSYANKCKVAIANNTGPKNDIEGTLAKIVIPQLNFTDASIGEVLEYFSVRAEELTGGKFVPNFIYKGTTDQRDNTLITLNLRNVPMTEAIRYVGQLSRTQFRYEEHAIVADPNFGRGSSAPATNAAPAPVEPPGTVFGEPVKNIFE